MRTAGTWRRPAIMPAMVLMDYAQVSWLMCQLNTAAAELPTLPTTGYPSPPPYSIFDASAFGNTLGAAECHASWQTLSFTAKAAGSHLQQTLQADWERLEEVLTVFQQLDHEEADEISSSGGPLTVVSYHVHHNPDQLSGESNDDLRARQIGEVVDYAAGVDGPAITGGDNNTTLVPDEQRSYDDDAVDALSGYGEEGFTDVGEVGPTFGGERTIDHIHARGVAADEPAFVDGGPSDHDGQTATYLITGW